MNKDRIIKGAVYVLGDNIDTDAIIPAQHLNLVPTIPEEYGKLGTYALSGLPENLPAFVGKGGVVGRYAVVIAGTNFGCGSSREHAPIALGAAGVRAVVAQSYARIFFRNAVATGELYPLESRDRLCDILKTGDAVEINLDAGVLTATGAKRSFELRPLGAVKPVIDAGGIFGYARATGMIGAGRKSAAKGAEAIACE